MANEDAIRPAMAAVRPQVSSKNMGNMDTTASSAPKLAKYVVLSAATDLNG